MMRTTRQMPMMNDSFVLSIRVAAERRTDTRGRVLGQRRRQRAGLQDVTIFSRSRS